MGKVKPLYVHDCERCTFLGVLFGEVDVYECNKEGLRDASYIFRDSDEGSDYASWRYVRQDLIDLGRKGYSGLSDDDALILGLVKSSPSIVLNNFQRS